MDEDVQKVQYYCHSEFSEESVPLINRCFTSFNMTLYSIELTFWTASVDRLKGELV